MSDSSDSHLFHIPPLSPLSPTLCASSHLLYKSATFRKFGAKSTVGSLNQRVFKCYHNYVTYSKTEPKALGGIVLNASIDLRPSVDDHTLQSIGQSYKRDQVHPEIASSIADCVFSITITGSSQRKYIFIADNEREKLRWCSMLIYSIRDERKQQLTRTNNWDNGSYEYDDRLEVHGWLTKNDSSGKSWKRRYFIYSRISHTLSYYKQKPDVSGIIPLYGATITLGETFVAGSATDKSTSPPTSSPAKSSFSSRNLDHNPLNTTSMTESTPAQSTTSTIDNDNCSARPSQQYAATLSLILPSSFHVNRIFAITPDPTELSIVSTQTGNTEESRSYIMVCNSLTERNAWCSLLNDLVNKSKVPDVIVMDMKTLTAVTESVRHSVTSRLSQSYSSTSPLLHSDISSTVVQSSTPPSNSSNNISPVVPVTGQNSSCKAHNSNNDNMPTVIEEIDDDEIDLGVSSESEEETEDIKDEDNEQQQEEGEIDHDDTNKLELAIDTTDPADISVNVPRRRGSSVPSFEQFSRHLSSAVLPAAVSRASVCHVALPLTEVNNYLAASPIHEINEGNESQSTATPSTDTDPTEQIPSPLSTPIFHTDFVIPAHLASPLQHDSSLSRTASSTVQHQTSISIFSPPNYTPEQETKHVQMLQKTIEEFFTTEKTYVHGLSTLIRVYLLRCRAHLKLNLQPTLLTEREIATIFSNIELIYDVNRKLFSELEQLKNKGDLFHNIGAAFRQYIPFFKMCKSTCNRKQATSEAAILLQHLSMIFDNVSLCVLYTDTIYVKTYDDAIRMVKQLTTKRPAFKNFLDIQEMCEQHSFQCNSTTCIYALLSHYNRICVLTIYMLHHIYSFVWCYMFSFEAFLILPVQRVPRYVLLLETIKKHAPASYPNMHDIR